MTTRFQSANSDRWVGGRQTRPDTGLVVGSDSLFAEHLVVERDVVDDSIEGPKCRTDIEEGPRVAAADTHVTIVIVDLANPVGGTGYQFRVHIESQFTVQAVGPTIEDANDMIRHVGPDRMLDVHRVVNTDAEGRSGAIRPVVERMEDQFGFGRAPAWPDPATGAGECSVVRRPPRRGPPC